MTLQLVPVYSTVDWEGTPDCLEVDPEQLRDLLNKAKAAFSGMPEMNTILVNSPPHIGGRFGEQCGDEDRTTLGEYEGERVAEVDLDNDCDIRWRFSHLSIERPFISATTGVMTTYMRLVWTSSYTADEMFADFHLEN